MSLRKIHIEKLAHSISGFFAESGQLKASPDAVSNRIISVLSENMDMERRLDDEAHKLLEKNRKMMGMDIDEQKAFFMIKKQLAKQKGFVL